MSKEQKSYREIFKATSLFGGVQVLNIVIAVVRSKFVAVLLGPTGMGITGLFYSTTEFIGRLTNFGLGTSAVKNVAEAAATGDEEKIVRVVSVLRKLVWITGMLGLVATAAFSPLLSRITFGNSDYTVAFIWISVTLLFQQLTSGQLVILQGLRKLQYLAKANLLGSVLGLVIIIPLYYYLRIGGIVPAIILIAVANLLLSWYFSSKVGVKSAKVSTQDTYTEGKDMMKMGFLLSMSVLITAGASYLIRIFISNKGGVDDVGLYNAGFAIINTYVGMIFTAMGTDYYPRLSAVSNDNSKSAKLINQQAEIAILILAPILAVFLIFINWVIIILYSNKFLAVNEMIHWAALGMFFKAMSWSIAYVFIAKGAAKLFFWSELISNINMLLLNIAGYYLAGLEGLGISFLAGYLVYLLQVYFIARFKYSFRFDKVFVKVATIQIALGVACFLILRTLETPWTYLAGSAIIALSAVYSFIELDKRIGIKEIVRNQIKRFVK
ncbi:MAG: O-antigen translocase [Bacteroidales bacterium]|nr:O-antigen translocase [Bacteroidales bacterium]